MTTFRCTLIGLALCALSSAQAATVTFASDPFAGTAANLIADAITSDGAGFFVYSNRVLGVNRLVYSTNLNRSTADLSVLARIESPSGAAALAAISSFGVANFAVAQVPEPGTLALTLAGLAVVGANALRRRA